MKMITYADIEEIYSQEKNRKNAGILQKIDENFYPNFAKMYNSSEEYKEYLGKLGEDIYTERMQKILIHALRASIGNIKEPLNITKEEKEIYNKILELIKTYKNDLLFGKEKNDAKNDNEQKKKQLRMNVRFLNSCPGIVGDDLQKYGPFKDKDVAEITESLAKILVKAGFVEYEAETG
ncbi:hypothetical protein MSIBF_A1410024 [groundwater metagenome]|uniref:Uncharacterized protein n=1 Tax=groundwater metagenome TaxID=717931 RepID=A0A098E671_9ZZZZ